MEKKGDILNQLAIISDLLENANLITSKTTVVFELDRTEFNRLYNIVNIKAKLSSTPPKDTFQILVGNITFVFNTNNA